MSAAALMKSSSIVLACLPGGKALLGLSGGPDSVALLHLLLAAGHRDLVVCHLNHSLRGRESDEDAAFARSLAESHGLECEIAKVDVRARAKKKHLSIETAAREARHAFFKRVSRQHGTREVLLAHHADDQAETILGNMLRGCGLDGIVGMRLVTRLDGGIHLLRPLLRTRRAAIDAYLIQQGLAYREDSSNASFEHRRNRIRHEALPLLGHIAGRDVTPLINRLGLIAESSGDFLDKQAAAWLQQCLEGRALCQLDVLRGLHPGLLHRVIALWMRELLKLPGIGFKEIGGVSAMLLPGARAKVNLPAGFFARRKAGRLWVERLPS